MPTPKNIRCIGIASVIYSLWSSLRYRHLAQWQASVFPPSLIGGICGRNGDESEWLLSMDLHSEHSDTMALFLDRFKCFDMVIMATRADPFLDPFGKWVLHVFSKFRKMTRSNPVLAARVLQDAQRLVGRVQHTSNGVAAVFALLCQELQWSIVDSENFVIRPRSAEKSAWQREALKTSERS